MKFTGKDGELRIYSRSNGYVKVHFSNMDFSGPIGRPKREETLVLDRGIVDQYGHYISGNDMVIFDPVSLSWSCFIDDVTHVSTIDYWREVLVEALTCRYAESADTQSTWTEYGDSTKGTSQLLIDLDGADPIYTPYFVQPQNYLESGTVSSMVADGFTVTGKSWLSQERADCIVKFTSGAYKGKTLLCKDCSSGDILTFYEDPATLGIVPTDTIEIYDNLRTVDIQFKLTGELNDIVWKFKEVYFPPEEITLSEAEDAINMAITGGVYGKISRETDWS